MSRFAALVPLVLAASCSREAPAPAPTAAPAPSPPPAPAAVDTATAPAPAETRAPEGVTKDACEKAFDRLVQLRISEVRRGVEAEGRPWSPADRSRAMQTAFDGKDAEVAACRATATPAEVACRQGAATIEAWKACRPAPE